MEVPENVRVNEHAIKLIDGKQPLYSSIYTLSLVELETLKAYIKTQQKTGFIWSFKSPVSASIFFNKKLDNSFRLYVDYQGLNNLTIKNQYAVSLIREILNQLSWAKQFTQLNLTSAYHQMKIWEDNK